VVKEKFKLAAPLVYIHCVQPILNSTIEEFRSIQAFTPPPQQPAGLFILLAQTIRLFVTNNRCAPPSLPLYHPSLSTTIVPHSNSKSTLPQQDDEDFINYKRLILKSLIHHQHANNNDNDNDQCFKTLLNGLKHEFHLFRSFAPIRALFNYRCAHLEESVTNYKQLHSEEYAKFDWRMPDAKLTDVPSINEFFMSNEQCLDFHSDNFTSIQQARIFLIFKNPLLSVSMSNVFQYFYI
jgi:hypothetical protein